MRRMRRTITTAVVAALPLLGAAGCTDFLSSGEAQDDPNRPTSSTRGQRLVSALANVWAFQTGQFPRLTSMWMQQFAGTDRQYQALGIYEISEGTYGGAWGGLGSSGAGGVYAGAGLLDLRGIQEESRAANDRVFLGIAQTLEALTIGTAASLWGDIPYSQALVESTPTLDTQLDVYDALQKLLDEAIANLGSGQGLGPGSADRAYGGNAAKWTQLAYTLKARYYMHTAEVRGTAAYAAALQATQRGISTPANDFRAMHTNTPGEMNLWHQFIEIERQGYISPGEFLVDLLKETDDPRLERYFEEGSTGEFIGAPPGSAFSPSFSSLSSSRNDPDFDQPIVTHAENLLIAAEAAYQTGSEATALARLNAAREMDDVDPIVATGRSLLEAIMREKYIQLFQNLEVYNDWKRTCYPNITPAANRAEIPARFLYPVDERQTNPNVPSVAEQPARNANDPPGGTLNSAAACLGG